MAYRLPVFNLAVNIWTWNLPPPVNPPRVITIGNLAVGKRISNADAFLANFVKAWLLLPAFTDVRSAYIGLLFAGPDLVEVPGGSGRFYTVDHVDDFGKGFANEHRFAVLMQNPNQPMPLP